MEEIFKNLSNLRWFIFCFVFCPIGCLAKYSSEDLFLIRNTHSNLVVDAVNTSLTAQYFTVSPSQLWSFQPGDQVGLFFIVNNKTGEVMDTRNCTEERCEMFVSKKMNRKSQQWHLNDNGRIVNNDKKGHNLDLLNGNAEPGNSFILWRNNGFEEAQRFRIEKVELPSNYTDNEEIEDGNKVNEESSEKIVEDKKDEEDVKVKATNDTKEVKDAKNEAEVEAAEGVKDVIVVKNVNDKEVKEVENVKDVKGSTDEEIVEAQKDTKDKIDEEAVKKIENQKNVEDTENKKVENDVKNENDQKDVKDEKNVKSVDEKDLKNMKNSVTTVTDAANTEDVKKVKNNN